MIIPSVILFLVSCYDLYETLRVQIQLVLDAVVLLLRYIASVNIPTK